MNLASWVLGLSFILLTIAIHTTAVVLMAFRLESRARARIDNHRRDPRRELPAAIGRIGAVALILTALHGLEGVLWASAYTWLGAFESFTDASTFSLASMTTFDLPGNTLPSRFHLFSVLEAVNGVLLFGISTAFLFAVMQVHWQVLFHHHEPANQN
ncbi:hypothetical protein [Mycolicibacterium monacense]|uniref:Two pore domain potassium channel family protein n=3 Tax=unclassified Mycobacterium TaxID=2642494 RepID=A0A5Q5BQE6_MYCSS|nr:hypothetical protein [Mycolicibacterium monacense]OBB76493.1 hypothetical protein A6B34_12070 [Mycolicibacterium monacense]OBF51193.1 hypothetical protein A5778_17430 [Mycolicibacterium monacense]ORB22152.1 hypothetical protein BST34_08190 [Mycolicibacterium monacense DSM 44395]QHP89439.1 hypothetical protein EWR22_24875 [Mycolicibacterium monacense DSM 44395]